MTTTHGSYMRDSDTITNSVYQCLLLCSLAGTMGYIHFSNEVENKHNAPIGYLQKQILCLDLMKKVGVEQEDTIADDITKG